jgi:hypothetical protein
MVEEANRNRQLSIRAKPTIVRPKPAGVRARKITKPKDEPEPQCEPEPIIHHPDFRYLSINFNLIFFYNFISWFLNFACCSGLVDNLLQSLQENDASQSSPGCTVVLSLPSL